MRDPVCGMTVGEGALTVEGYPEFGFCSEHCRKTFQADPAQFLEGAESGDVGSDSEEAAEEDAEADHAAPAASASGEVATVVATGSSRPGARSSCSPQWLPPSCFSPLRPCARRWGPGRGASAGSRRPGSFPPSGIGRLSSQCTRGPDGLEGWERLTVEV